MSKLERFDDAGNESLAEGSGGSVLPAERIPGVVCTWSACLRNYRVGGIET
jgi:hypothetical protein